MPDKIDTNLVAVRVKMLADDGKLFGTEGKALPELAAAYHKALVKLNIAVEGLKPKPDKNAELKKIKELQTRLFAEAAARSYELAHKQDEFMQGGLSPSKRKKIMLANLVELGKASLQQHTGDKGGEMYNRPAMRQILGALKSLKDSSAHLDTVDKITKKLGDRKSRISDKATVSDLKGLIEEADTAVKVAKTIEDALVTYEDEVGKKTKDLRAALETEA